MATKKMTPGVVPLEHDEIKDLRATFKLFDKDNSDTIPTSNLGTIWRSMGQNPTEQEIQQMIAMVDRDESGLMTWDEFYLLLGKNTIKSQDQMEEEMRESFQLFDKDGNGFVDANELATAMTSFGDKLTEEEAQEMISMVDIDGDGRLNYDEFVVAFTSRQQITEEEIREAQAQSCEM